MQGHDEVADLQRSLNEMVLRLRQVAGDLALRRQRFGAASSSSSQLSQGSTTQASAVEDTSAAAEQRTANLRQAAESAEGTEALRSGRPRKPKSRARP